MGYDLVNPKNEVYHCPLMAFRAIIELAERHGWQPMGTLPPEGVEEWDGNYFYYDGQIIAREDLEALAEALEHALSLSSELYLSEDRADIQDFLDFCRESEYLVIY